MPQNLIVPTISSAFTPEKVALIKRTIADGATDDELALFIAQCQRTGLDPFSRQIYAIQRQVFDPKLNRKVNRMVTQVSIDGLRLIAERSGLYAGQIGPFWCSQEVNTWSDIWSSKNYPFAAKVGVIRRDFSEPLYSVAYWSEYCPTYDGKPAQMWTRFPTLMLAKCAEASALRRAFPQELAGLFTPEEITESEIDHSRFQSDIPFDSPSQIPDPVEVSTSSPSSQLPVPSPVTISPVNVLLDGEVIYDEDQSQSSDARPYSPLRLQARIAEVAAKSQTIPPNAFDQLAFFFRETIPDDLERGRVLLFLAGSNDIRHASTRVLSAIHRWLNFNAISKPAILSLEELNGVRAHLSSPKF